MLHPLPHFFVFISQKENRKQVVTVGFPPQALCRLTCEVLLLHSRTAGSEVNAIQIPLAFQAISISGIIDNSLIMTTLSFVVNVLI